MTAGLNDLPNHDDPLYLLRILRRNPDPRRRASAARQIPDLDNLDLVEGLIRAHLADNDPQVKEAALKALEDILGKNEASLAIRAYGPVDGTMDYEDLDAEVDPYHEEGSNRSETHSEFLDFSHGSSGHAGDWEPPQNGVLIMFLEDDTHPDRQLKVIPLIGANLNPAGIDALCMIALWSQNPEVSHAARKELENHFGDETLELLENFKISQSVDLTEEVDWEDENGPNEEDFEKENKPLFTEYPSVSSASPTNDSRQEGTPTWLIILLILLIIAAGAVYWFYLR